MKERCKAVLPGRDTKKNAFLKNEAGKLLKTHDEPKNKPETNPKTKRAMLLKIEYG